MYGIINLYKEKGITSFKQINMLKSLFPGQKIGHTGTLDPIAEGVLIVCIGKATRIADYIQAQKKIYKTEMILGLSTDSYDITGKILSIKKADDISDKTITDTIDNFKGKQWQEPPVFSAKKVDGRKLYQYAVNEQPVEIKKSYIEIMNIGEIKIYDYLYENTSVKKIVFTVECSKGTYIRSLCHDIGEMLQKGGTMSALTRLQVGNFNINNSYTVEKIRKHSENNLQDIFIPVEDAVELPHLYLTSDEMKKYINGVKLKKQLKKGDYIIKDINDKVAGIGIADENGILKGKILLNEDYKK